MLDKLVESKNNKQDTKQLRGLFLVTSTIAFSGIVFALIFSLFAQNLAMGHESIVLSSLIMPPQIIDEKPAPPKPDKKPEKLNNQNVENKTPIRVQNILRLHESPQKVPQAISTQPAISKARPIGDFKIGSIDVDPIQTSSIDPNGEFKNNGPGEAIKITPSKPIEVNEIKKPEKPKQELPPPPKPVVQKPKNIIVSGGVINGKAKHLVKPSYPAAAKMAQIRGQVTVKVLIDENGNVKSADAVDGHKLLQKSAEMAALRSTFTPTFLSNNKVKVSGLIIYNFN